MNAPSTDRYVEVVIHEDEGSFWAESPQMPRWSAAGRTYQEVADMVPEAARFFLGEGSYTFFIHGDVTPQPGGEAER